MSETYSEQRFYVLIDGAPAAVFAEASGLQSMLDTRRARKPRKSKTPSRRPCGHITLKRGITTGNDFYRWYVELAARRKIQRRNLSVILYASDGSELSRWNFLDAYPVRWSGPQYEATSAALAVETIELAHAGIQTS